MRTNIATAATSTDLIPAAVQSAGGREYTDEEVRRPVAAFEEPFGPQGKTKPVTVIACHRKSFSLLGLEDSERPARQYCVIAQRPTLAYTRCICRHNRGGANAAKGENLH